MTKFISQNYKNKNDVSPQGKHGRATMRRLSLNVVLLALIIFIGISYLYYINQTATGGFDIKGLESSIEQLTKENKTLEIEAAKLRSLSHIEQASQELEMVATARIEYLSSTDTSVAVK